MIRVLLCSLVLLVSLHVGYGLPSLADASETYDNRSRFGLMFDAGSSGTRLFIYQWFGGEIPSVWGAPVFHPFNSSDWTLRVQPGISSFSSASTEALQAYFEPFLSYAMSRIPVDYWKRTYVFLYATAGMRLLTPAQQTHILNTTRKIMLSWPFRLEFPNWIRIISGVDEGVYGWLSTNYLLQTFQFNNASHTVGALDLGGASTQITFATDHPLTPEQGGTSITVGKTTYQLYSTSYLGLGIDQARHIKNEQLANYFCNVNETCHLLHDYCSPIGYTTSLRIWNNTFVETRGASNGSICNLEIEPVFSPSSCTHCPIGDVYQPPLHGHFYAMSGYTYSLEMWRMNGTNSSILDIEHQALQWCSLTYSEIRDMFPNVPPPFLTAYCFTGLYQTQLLRKLGFDPSSRSDITYSNKIGATPLSWTLGAMVYAAQEVDKMLDSKN